MVYIWERTLNLFYQMFIHVNTNIFIKAKTIHTNYSEADSWWACENEGDIKYLWICIANNYKSKRSGQLWNEPYILQSPLKHKKVTEEAKAFS